MLAAVRQGTFIFSNSSERSSLQYIPEHSLLQTAGSLENPERNLTVESLHFIPISSDNFLSSDNLLSSDSDLSRLAADADNLMLLTCYNTLRSVSTQEGITYISQRRGGEPHELIETSYHVADEHEKTPIEDPAVSVLPLRETDTVYQEDSSFGGNYFLYEYHVDSAEKPEIYLRITNLTPFRVFGLFKAVDEKSLIMHVSIIPVSDGIITYTAAQALGRRKTDVSILGFRIDLLESIRNRIQAVQEWFEKRIIEELSNIPQH